MERTKENKTPLEEQGQELSRGERRECRGRQALCRVSRGQRPFGRVQGGSACWVSRGQSPLGRVQGDNACSGVQRVKPLAQ